MRVIVADDEVLLREKLTQLLTETKFEVIKKTNDDTNLLHLIERHRPDLVLVDIKMPPTHTDEDLTTAQEIDAHHPNIGVLVLSHYLEPRYAMRLLEEHPHDANYLLKDRVSDIAVLANTLHRIAENECVIDPTIVSHLVNHRHENPLEQLTEREREMLALITKNHSNKDIDEHLYLSARTVETHIRQIFLKLNLRATPTYHRHVVAVLTFLHSN